MTYLLTYLLTYYNSCSRQVHSHKNFNYTLNFIKKFRESLLSRSRVFADSASAMTLKLFKLSEVFIC